MLVVTRKRNEAIVIGDGIEVRVLRVGSDGVRLGITAPSDVAVHRREIYDLIRAANESAATGAGGLGSLLQQSCAPTAGPRAEGPALMPFRCEDWRTVAADRITPLYSVERERWSSRLDWNTTVLLVRSRTRPGGRYVAGLGHHRPHRHDRRMDVLSSPPGHAADRRSVRRLRVHRRTALTRFCTTRSPPARRASRCSRSVTPPDSGSRCVAAVSPRTHTLISRGTCRSRRRLARAAWRSPFVGWSAVISARPSICCRACIRSPTRRAAVRGTGVPGPNGRSIWPSSPKAMDAGRFFPTGVSAPSPVAVSSAWR